MGCLRRGTRVHFVPGSMAPVTFDLSPARSRSGAYHFHPFAGGQSPMTILLDALRTELVLFFEATQVRQLKTYSFIWIVCRMTGFWSTVDDLLRCLATTKLLISEISTCDEFRWP